MKTSKAKRVIAVLLVAIMATALFPIQSFAASKVVNLKENIKLGLLSQIETYTVNGVSKRNQIWDCLTKGTHSAKKESGTWYYYFIYKNTSKKDGITYNADYSLRIPVSEFRSAASAPSPSTQLKNVNAKLAEYCNAMQNNEVHCLCYTKSNKKVHGQTSTTRYSYQQYFVNIYHLGFSAWANKTNEMTLQSNYYKSVTFIFNTYLPDSLKEPSTEWDYYVALYKKVNSSSTPAISPIIDVNETNTGKNNICLSTYFFTGVGNASANVNVNSYVTVFTTTANLVANTAAGKYATSAFSLASLVGQVNKFTKVESRTYNSGNKEAPLSVGNKKALQARFNCDKNATKTLVKLSQPNDYIQSVVKFNKARDKSTKFSFKCTFA